MGLGRLGTSISIHLVFFLSMLSVVGGGKLFAFPRVERIVLSNQLVLLAAEDHSLPLVTLRILIDAGSRRDPPGKEGVANLTAKGLLLGTSTYSVTAFHDALEFMGASLSASVGPDTAVLRLRILREDLDRGFDLLMEALTRPTFSEEEIQRLVRKTRAEIQSAEERPGVTAKKAFQKTLFYNNPYGHPVKGTEKTLGRITGQTILEFYKTYYRPNGAIVAIVGDVTLEEIKQKLGPRLSDWPMAKIPDERFTPSFTKGPKDVKIDRNITQANIVFGHRGIKRSNPDFYAATVMNYILGGGGFGSRLFEEIRVKRGLAYSVASYFDQRRYPGSFRIVLQTKNTSARRAISVLRQETRRIQNEPVSKKDLERAKKYLVGSFPFRFDTQARLAGFITHLEYHGLGLDFPEKYPSYVSAVTSRDVLRVAASYLHPDQAILVVVANLKEAGMDEPSR